MIGVEQWAEIRRLVLVERRSKRRLLACSGCAGHGREGGGSANAAEVRAPTVGRSSIRSRSGSASSCGWTRRSSRSGCGRWPASLAMRAASRSSMTTSARSGRGFWSGARSSGRSIGRGSWCSAICGSRGLIAVGHGQLRRGYVVTAELCWSRVIAGALVFSKEAPDILWGWPVAGSDRGVAGEAGVGSGGRDRRRWPSDRRVRRVLRSVRRGLGDPRSAGDAQAKGTLERSHRFMRTNFEPGRRFANHHDFQAQLDGWCDRVNRRVHRTTRAVPAERLLEERARMRPLPPRLPDTDRRVGDPCPAAAVSSGSIATTTRSTRGSPAVASRCASPRPRSPPACWTPASWRAGTVACSPAALTFTDPAHQTELERQRARRRQRHEVEVEIRPLSRYDALIPA